MGGKTLIHRKVIVKIKTCLNFPQLAAFIMGKDENAFCLVCVTFDTDRKYNNQQYETNLCLDHYLRSDGLPKKPPTR